MTLRLILAVMMKPLRTMSLKTRVMIWVSLLIFAGIWSLATIVATFLQADLEKMITQQLSATLDHVVNEIDHEMQFRINALNKLAATITPEIQADPVRLQRLLKQSELSSTLFPEGLTCSNSQGIIFADSPVLEGRLGGSLKDRKYFREIMAGAKQAIGGPVLARFVNKPIVALGVPLRDASGATAGMLVGVSVLSDPDLFGQIEQTKIGKTGYFMVFSPKERLIVSATDKSRILTPLPARGVNHLLDRRLEEGFEGTGFTVNPQGAEVMAVSRGMKSTGWILLAGITTEEAFAPLVTLKQQIYLGALLISLLVALILRYALKRQLAPLVDAAAAIERMSAGEATLAPIAVVRKDEIGLLVGNFNRLVEAHNRSELEIHNLNESLERRVVYRTSELQVTNLQLEKEICERKSAESLALDFSSRLKVMTRRLASVQEAEKRRLARELHDRVSSSLMAIGLNLELIKKQLPKEAAASISGRLSDTADLVKETMYISRDISADLHPAALDYGGVFGALEDYALKFMSRTGIAVVLTGKDREVRFPPETEIALYRIAQEALTNCAKHAYAKTVVIALNGDAEHAIFAISDDGTGFDLTKLGDGENKPGLGLLSMRERAEAIGGTLGLKSAPGLGTRIIVEI